MQDHSPAASQTPSGAGPLPGRTRHRIFYMVVHAILSPILRIFFRFRCAPVKRHDYPYLLVANHTMPLDPIFVGAAFRDPLYFVASEQLFRLGVRSWLLQVCFAPIPRMKARTEMRAAMEVLRRLRAGHAVCMFAEGSTSWDGKTGAITPATAKLVKKSGAALITYRIDGGYFTRPRWARGVRAGGVRGTLVREYSPAQLAAMSAEEVYAALVADLDVDAYAAVSREGWRYPSARRAERLETAIFLCPECGKMGTLHSEGPRFFCDCGLTLRLDGQYRFCREDGGDPPFSTITAWMDWQRARLRDRCHTASPGVELAADEGLSLYEFTSTDETVFLGEGRLSLSREGLSFRDADGCRRGFLFSQLSDLALLHANMLTFTADGRHYEMRSPRPYSALKYALLTQELSSLRVML